MGRATFLHARTLPGDAVSKPLSSRCTLELAGSVVLVSHGGTPETECALFDPGEIELEAERPGTNREKGYRTTAGAALRRLAEAGVTPQLAAEAADLVRPALARSYARGDAARCVVDRLEADELFEARTYDATTGRYEGTWLDLTALARDLGPGNAGALLQALHLAATLASLPEDAQITLSTADAARRPGERTLRRVDLSGARAVVDTLRDLRPARAREAIDAGPTRAEVIAWIHERARQSPTHQRRFAAMEAALSAREAPARGPLSETALWNLESKLTRGELTGVLEQIDEIEKRRGRAPGTTYLRARLALMTQSEDPRTIAERASALSTSMVGFHEVELLAAQAWLAAGDGRRARAYARDLHENVSAHEVLRTQALAILQTAGPASSAANIAVQGSGGPPSMPPSPRVHVDPIGALQAIPRAPRAPSASELEAAGAGSQPPMRTSSASMRSLPPGTSFPPYRVEARGERTPTSLVQGTAETERLETLSLPPGVHAEPPPSNDPPRNPGAARLACTYLARELGRELRLRHGVDIRDDLDGLETAQRYLRETFVDGRVRTPDEEREIMRHGAFLSELVARRLGGAWVEVQSRDAGTWAMLVPSRSRPQEVVRVWPFGRVLRFVVMGHRERDLVSYYLELEGRSR
jgi:hypothetical protein